MCVSVGNANLLSDHFDCKLSREAADRRSNQSPSLTTYVFRLSEVRRLLLPYDGTDQLGVFPLFLRRTADVVTLHLSVVFRRFVRLGSLKACWRHSNFTPIPKGPPPSVANYRPISLTSVLSKVFERLVYVMKRSGVLPTT